MPLTVSCVDAVCYRTTTIGEVRDHSVGDSSRHSEFWNCLDMAPVIPGTVPSFLYRGRNDALRWHAARRIVSRKSAGRSYLARIKDSGHWMLLAQGGAITLPHEDAFGDDTYLVNYAEERKRFSHNLSVPLEKARFSVLRCGEAVFFRGGTIHFIFRLPFSNNTLMFGGHILRWSGLENSLEVALRH
ncbi:hypothetical protein K469DRAFT_691714 [Zopfia rhizophila CBS 207.26]|uniref:JmjC domain-containing protein n=1 Tax=Zopfia rhizophila CBS 207.26 TaxID=1314779 RepID=A0A6A6DR72_9PEZI|nr:hypothetical protein K469DRAFT_691714 [Zopfia rhizophila CBS 207.26]